MTDTFLSRKKYVAIFKTLLLWLTKFINIKQAISLSFKYLSIFLIILNRYVFISEAVSIDKIGSYLEVTNNLKLNCKSNTFLWLGEIGR